MYSTKVSSPRKLEEKEYLDTFDDFLFQVEKYYGHDPKFAGFINDPNLTMRSKDVLTSGLLNADSATNINTLLRALATYALGPYHTSSLVS